MKRSTISIFLFFLLLFPFSLYGNLRIVASIFPLYDFTREIVRDKGEVHLLIRPGTDYHHFDPSPNDILKVKGASFFVYSGKELEPWAGKILRALKGEKVHVIDVSSGLKLETLNGNVKDPHIWLDFSFVERIVDTIAKDLSEKDPKNGEFYMRNSTEYKERVRSLDKKYSEVLSTCRIRTIVHAGHYSFGYLAKRYNLQYVSAYPVTMESEPKPSQIAKMKETIIKNRAKYVFYEEVVSPKVAKILARELKIGILRLNPAGNVSKKDFKEGVTFLRIMEENLKNLKRGLECQE